MNLKRLITGVVGLPIVIIFFIFANPIIFDIFIAIIAMMSIYEYIKSAKSKYKVVKWISYLSCISIAFISFIPKENMNQFILIGIFSILIVLFMQVIFSEMKYNVSDIAITFFGIIYIVGFLTTMALLFGIENGKNYIWYLMISAWATDICAYFVGKNFGKHKFSKVSPNKTIEGCIGGAIGAVIVGILYTLAVNQFAGLNLNIIYMSIILFILSIVGQIGDFAASTIKRHFEVKDFSDFIPGHGGLLDRIDSVIFIAPVAYFIFTTFL